MPLYIVQSLMTYKRTVISPDASDIKGILPAAAPHIKTVAEREDMEFLKDILGEELYKQLLEKINAHNGNEANKENQIKLGNIGSGDYVSKLKYEDIVNQLKSKGEELETANGLIKELKKGTKDDDELQGKITGYETQVAQLQDQLRETKIKAAVKVALLSEKAVDVDYLTYKLNENLKEKGESLELDENDNIKGWADKLSGLKTQFPTMFETKGRDDMRVLGDNRLPENNNGQSEPKNLAEALKMDYESKQND